MVREFHHPRDGGVERQLGDIIRDRADRLMEDAVFFAVRRAIDDRRVELHCFGAVIDDEPPDAIEETEDAVDALHAPRLGGFERAHEHFVEAKRIGTVFGDDGIGVDDVAAALGHLLVVFAEDHALVDELLERLGRADDAAVEEHFVPEARSRAGGARRARRRRRRGRSGIQAFSMPGRWRVFIGRIEKPQVVPAGAGPLRHGVRFALVAFAVDDWVEPFLAVLCRAAVRGGRGV